MQEFTSALPQSSGLVALYFSKHLSQQGGMAGAVPVGPAALELVPPIGPATLELVPVGMMLEPGAVPVGMMLEPGAVPVG